MQVSYSSLQGIALLLMLGYTMYDLVFDAKLGIIARTLYRAMPDLSHYAVMAMMLVVGITMASHLTLGPMLPALNTFGGEHCKILLLMMLAADADAIVQHMSYNIQQRIVLCPALPACEFSSHVCCCFDELFASFLFK